MSDRPNAVAATLLSERELLIGERLEGHSVQRGDALAEDRLAVHRR